VNVKGWRALLLVGLAVAALLTLDACTDPEADVMIDEPPVDSVAFWPKTVKYAKYGDTLYPQIFGLKRRAECAIVMELGWKFRRDTTGSEFFRVRSRFQIPAGSSCAPDPDGLDTMFRVRFYTRVGNRLYLETPEGVITDSVLFVADETALATAVVLKHVPGTVDSTTSGRFTFYDSTATRSRRSIVVRSLAICEVLQTSVYEKRQDTLVVKIRLIQATPQPADIFPPCAGVRVDSVEVVPNTFNFLPGV
jgi:hypothetical protein